MSLKKSLSPYIGYAPTAALLVGLIFDIFTLDKPDAIFENTVIIGYLLLSAVTMIVLQARKEGSNEGRRLFLLSILQFSFGNLASALMVLYTRSGTLAGSAIFITILILLLLGNELLRNRYARTHLRVLIWFVLLLTYCSILIPVLMGSIAPIAFFTGIAAALLVTLLLVLILAGVAQKPFRKRAQRISASVLGATFVFLIFYVNNLIPPVPLALKHIGVYHTIERTNDTYAAAYESPAWFEFWRDTNNTYHQARESDPVYCFTSVYAPKSLTTEIRHRWEKYNEINDEWTTIARIPFPISGGRDAGFRGYTQTTQATEGTWRCSIETARGVLIGRTKFTVVAGEPDLKETEL